MKYIYSILIFLISTNVIGQDSIRWNLTTNDSVSSNSISVRGKNEKLGTNIPAVSYINSYQKITKPATGWPSTIDVNTNNSYIEFPLASPPINCFDTTGGSKVCDHGSSFFLQLIKLTGYVQQMPDSIIMAVYFYDTCNAGRYNNSHQYLGDFIIRSDNSSAPTNVYFQIPDFINKSIATCTDGRFSSIRLFPKKGGDFFMKNMTISGYTAFLLPINFTFFKAFAKNGSIELRWKIENLQDLEKFIIERSADGRSFEDVTTINRTINLNTTGIFTWSDKNPHSANNFYHIKAVEKTGKVILSEVVKINNSLKASGINIYPNPVLNKSLRVSINNVLSGKYQLTLINQFGQIVFSVPLSYAGKAKKH